MTPHFIENPKKIQNPPNFNMTMLVLLLEVHP